MGKHHKSKPDTTLSPLLMQQYLEGKLSAQEMHRVEKILLEDPFQQDAMEGITQSIPPELFQKEISDLKRRLSKRVAQSKTTLPFYQNKNWQIAAALALLLVISGIIYIIINASIPQEKASLAIQHKPANDSAISLPKADQLDEEANPQREQSFESEVQKNDNNTNTAQTPIAKNNADTSASEPEILPETQQHDLSIDKLNNNLPHEPATTTKPAQLEETMPQDMDLVKEELAAKKSRSMAAYGTAALPPVQVKGKVISAEDDSELPGVNVMNKNTNKGTITDLDGNFTLELPRGEQNLMLSYIGFTTTEKQYQITHDTTLLVKLSPDLQALSEVVVVGYGTTNKAPTPVPEYTSAEPIPDYRSFNNYLKENLKYPEAAVENNIQGKVKIELYVEPDGALTDLQVKKSLGYGCDEEALRLLREGPIWKAAMKNGQPVRQKTIVSIKFKKK